LRRVFSFPAVLAAGLVVLTLLTVRPRFSDPDTWWHLRVGESIVQTGALPTNDQYSYTTGHHAWIPHEWLSEALLYGVYRVGGNTGLWAWLWVVASLLLVLLYRVCWEWSGNAKVALLGGMVGWFFGTVSLAVRPLLLGHLFLTLELLVLYRRRWRWVLPPLFALWVNCHGSSALGLLVLGIFVASSFWAFEKGCLVAAKRSRRERATLAAVLGLSAAALLVNPVGLKLVTYPLDLLIRQSDNLNAIQEWQAVDVEDVRGVGLFAVAALVGLLLLVRPVRLYLEEVLLLALGFGLAVRHVRMLFVFGILAAPILCRALADLWPRYEPGRDNRPANAMLLALAVLVAALAFPRPAQLEAQVRAHNPVAAVDFIRKSGLSGPLLNHYQWGGYLLWALPEQKVFIDGRADIYDWTGVLREYSRWNALLEDPRRLLEKYRIRYCLLKKDAPIARVLPYLPGWRQVYADHAAVIFANGGANELAAAICLSATAGSADHAGLPDARRAGGEPAGAPGDEGRGILAVRAGAR
jgi:hypothetical protein